MPLGAGAAAYVVWGDVGPRLRAFAPCLQQVRRPGRPPCAYKGVAADKLHSEPGHGGVPVDGPQPEGDLPKLHRHGVQVHAEEASGGEVHLHPLLLPGVVVQRYLPACLLLFPAQVGLGKLVGGFVQEGGASHGGLADGDIKDFVRRFSLQQLLEGVLHQALHQGLGRVVGGALLPLPAREPVDEGSLFVTLEASVGVFYLFFVLVIPQGEAGDEVGHGEVVGGVALFADFKELLPGEEARIGEKALVDCAKLAYAEPGVGYPPGPAAAGGPGEGEEADHLLQGAVAEADALQEGRSVRVEEQGRKGPHPEGLPLSGGTVVKLQKGRAGMGNLWIAAEDQGEELSQGGVKVEAVPGLVPFKRDALHLPQALQAVGGAVGFGVHGGVVQLRPGLHIEEEEQPVEVPEALQGEAGGVQVALAEEGGLSAGADVVNGLVAQDLHRLPEGVAEVVGDGGGVPSGLCLHSVQQSLSFGGAEALSVEQHRDGLKGGGLPPGEDFVQVEPEGPLLPPLLPVQKQNLAAPGEKEPPGRLAPGEDVP